MTPLFTRFRKSLFVVAVLLFAFSAEQAQAQVQCDAYAGKITTDMGPICLHNGEALLTGYPDNNAIVPAGFTTTYILTRTNGLIIEQMGPSPNFSVNTVDTWRLHTLVFDPSTLDLSTVQFGSTSAYDVEALLIQGGGDICASLDIYGADIKTAECETPCLAFASGMMIDSTTICLKNGQATLTALHSGTSNVPVGFQELYLLTRTNGRIIEQISANPTFTVSTVDVWRIHNLVYDPNTLDLGMVQFGITSASDIQNLLLQGGGSICASLDMNGAFVKTGDCKPPCDAFASNMVMDSTTICLTGGEATLTAIESGSSTVPAGYEQLFVLTRTNGLIIEQVSPNPTFTVNTVDVWRIHNLVYDPSTLDLGMVQFGVTSAYDVQGLLLQGGGSICASLDMNGAFVKTGECTPTCFAEAGVVSADQPDLCLMKGMATLNATPDGNATVPTGYSLTYFLTDGSDIPVILAYADSPEFTVNGVGLYGVHPFVYDPTTFDLASMITAGTTLSDVNALLLQGGGGICASLDLEGADFQVVDCSPSCLADAGSMGAENEIPCLAEGSTVISAYSNGDTLVPPGFVMSYFLTHGAELVLLDLNSTPVFTVTDTGLYHIHAFVYDPATWNTTMITFGTTTAFDLNTMLTQGGGSICANLDFLGATITVTMCPSCTAGSDATISVCSSNAAFPLYTLLGGDPCPNGTWTAPNGIPFSGIFVPGLDPAGIYLYTVYEQFGANQTATVTVNVEAAPNAGSSAILSLCSTGGTVSLLDALDGTPDLDGVWTGPEPGVNGQFDPATMTAGTYTYTVSGSGPCPDATASVTVLIYSAPNAGIDGIVNVCLTDPPILLFPELNGEPDAGGTWTGPSPINNGVFDPGSMMAGTYTYTVAGLSPCVSETASLIVNVLECPAPCDAGTDGIVSVCYNDPAFPLIDHLGGDPCPDGTWTTPANPDGNGIFTPSSDAAGIYTYTVVTSDGTVSTATVTVNVYECPNEDLTVLPTGKNDLDNENTTTGVSTPDLGNFLTIWPNPASDRINITVPFFSTEGTQVELIDATGRTVQASPIASTVDQFTLDISMLPPGVWTLRIANADWIHVGRFVRSTR